MRRAALIATTFALGLATFAVSAKPPAASTKVPVKQPPSIALAGSLEPTCACDWTAGKCTTTWNDLSAQNSVKIAYGAEIEFEAEWTQQVTQPDGSVKDVKQKAATESDLDNLYACDGTKCTATAPITLPKFPAEAETSFLAKVKAMQTGAKGPKPRNFAKDTAECNLPK